MLCGNIFIPMVVNHSIRCKLVLIGNSWVNGDLVLGELVWTVKL